MFFLKLKAADFEDRIIPDVFVNQVKKRGVIECQTIDLKKLNQRVYESAMEAISQSDKVIQELLDSIRLQVRDLFRVCEAVALLRHAFRLHSAGDLEGVRSTGPHGDIGAQISAAPVA